MFEVASRNVCYGHNFTEEPASAAICSIITIMGHAYTGSCGNGYRLNKLTHQDPRGHFGDLGF